MLTTFLFKIISAKDVLTSLSLFKKTYLRTINFPLILLRLTLNQEILKSLKGSHFSITSPGEGQIEQSWYITNTERSWEMLLKSKISYYFVFGNWQPA